MIKAHNILINIYLMASDCFKITSITRTTTVLFTLTAFVFLNVLFQVSGFDYNISTPSEPFYKKYNIQYPINQYLDQENKKYSTDQIVRVNLGQSLEMSSQNYLINNVYDFQVSEIYERSGQSSKGNSFCDIVKVPEKNRNYEKYILSYPSPNELTLQVDQVFISTASSTKSTSYRNANSNNNQFFTHPGSFNGRIEEIVEQIQVYALTNKYNIHHIFTNISQIIIQDFQDRKAGYLRYFFGSSSNFRSNNKTVVSSIFTKRKNHDLCENSVELFSVNGRTIVKCNSQTSFGLYLVQLSYDEKQWWVDPSKGLVFDHEKKQSQIRSINNNGFSELYLRRGNIISELRINQERLQKKEINLGIEDMNIVDFYPIMADGKNPTLIIIDSLKGLIWFNIKQGKVELIQNFKNQIRFQDVEFLSYSIYNNFEMSKNVAGVLEIVVLTGRKQFIVEVFHEKINNNHFLHINKIYHNYNTNNKIQYFQGNEEDLENIMSVSRIQSIIHPKTVSKINNNIGIIKSRSKSTLFQYGIPRNIGHTISSSSQFLGQESFSKIVYLNDLVSDEQAKVQRNYSVDWIVNKIQQSPQPLSLFFPTLRLNSLMRYVITLKKSIFIEQLDPRSIYHYEYVCNLKQLGKIQKQHHIINDVKIKTEGVCQNKIGYIGQQQKILTHCIKEQYIDFQVRYETINQQRLKMRHISFLILLILVITIIMLVLALCWRKIKKQTKKLALLAQQKVRITENSTMEKNESGIISQKGQGKEMVQIID